MNALILALLLSATGPARGPHIVKQESIMVMHQYASPTWERHLWTHNPTNYAAWVYIECEHHLTVNPIGLAGRHTSEIVLPDIPPGEQCVVHHWLKQRGTQTPPPWSP